MNKQLLECRIGDSSATLEIGGERRCCVDGSLAYHVLTRLFRG